MRRNWLMGAASLILALAAGCGRSPQVNFYTLSPGVTLKAPAPELATPAVSVGPVTLPEALDRPQLVVRVAANRVEILEEQRWAEPLKSEIPRVVARNLGRLLGSSRVASYREQAAAGAEYRVLIDLLRLEAVPGEGVTLESNWTIRRGTDVVRGGHALLHEKAQGKGYEPLVAALSRALADLSGDLAAALRAEEGGRRASP